MSNDPYEPPAVDPDPDIQGTIDAPPIVVEHLRCTRPWVKFCSLAGYITSGFLILIAAVTVRGMMGRYSMLAMILIGSFYLILAILFTIPSMRLSRYEKSITLLEVSHRLDDLEQAIAHQRAFWRQMAIMILLMLVIYLITIGFSAIVILSSR